MSTVKAKNHQIGNDGTASNNFTIYQPSTPDGTSRWAVGVSGSTTADVITVNSSGNVGIGTSSFAFSAAGRGNLEIAGSSTALVGLKGGSNQAYVYNDGTSVYVANNSASGNIVFQPANYAERMRIDSSGNVLVGTTTPLAGGSTFATTANARFAIQNTNASPLGLYVNYSTAPNGTGNEYIYCSDTSIRMTVRSNGGIANFSANNVNLSDEREKKNIELAGNYLDKICAIPVKTFLYNDQTDTDLNLGVIAQDVQAVAPELVSESNWGTEEEPKERLSIYQTDLQYALMKCIQEQQTIIETLKADIAELKAKVN